MTLRENDPSGLRVFREGFRRRVQGVAQGVLQYRTRKSVRRELQEAVQGNDHVSSGRPSEAEATPPSADASGQVKKKGSARRSEPERPERHGRVP